MFNLQIAAGRLADDIELRHTNNGNPVCNLVVMTTSYNSGKGERETQPIRVVVFGAQATACANNIGKGHTVLCLGRLRERTWKDRQGNERRTTEMIAQSVQFLARPASESGLSSQAKDIIASALDLAAGVALASGDKDNIDMVKKAKQALGGTNPKENGEEPPPDDDDADAYAEAEKAREQAANEEPPPPQDGEPPVADEDNPF